MIHKSEKDILVVTPTLGKRKTLKKTAETINQIFPKRAHHIVTGPMSAKKLILQLAPHAEFVREKRHEGVYAAVNDVLRDRASEYKYLTYLNDDDFWLPSYSGLANILDHNTNIDIAYGRTICTDENGKTLSPIAHFPIGAAFSNIAVCGIPIFTQQSSLIRSSLYTELLGFDESYKLVADTDFFIRANIAKKRIKSIQSYCSCFCKQEAQLSNNSELMIFEYQNMISKNNLHCGFKSHLLHACFRIYNLPNYLIRLLKTRKLKY